VACGLLVHGDGDAGGDRDDRTDLGGRRAAASEEGGRSAPQPVEGRDGEAEHRGDAAAHGGTAGGAAAQVRAERLALAPVEAAAREPSDDVAPEALAEDEHLRKLVPGREQRLLHLVGAEVKLARDLGDAQPVELAEDVGAPLPLRERRDRRDERAPDDRALVWVAGRRDRLLAQLRAQQLAAAGQRVDRRVVRDPVQPGPHAGGEPAGPERLVRAEERALRHVLAGRQVAQQVRGVGRELVRVAVIELVEGGRLARCETAAEPFVRRATKCQRAHLTGGTDAPSPRFQSWPSPWPPPPRPRLPPWLPPSSWSSPRSSSCSTTPF
jgi:hypothetical protein